MGKGKRIRDSKRTARSAASEQETYYIVKLCDLSEKCQTLHCFQTTEDGKATSTGRLMSVMGYFKANIYSFWTMLSEEQQDGAIIVSRSVLKIASASYGPSITTAAIKEDIQGVHEASYKAWMYLRENALPVETAKAYSDGKPVKY